jgi:hypothetical protein
MVGENVAKRGIEEAEGTDLFGDKAACVKSCLAPESARQGLSGTRWTILWTLRDETQKSFYRADKRF